MSSTTTTETKKAGDEPKTFSEGVGNLVDNVKAACTPAEPTTGQKIDAKIAEVQQGASDLATYGTTEPTIGQKIGHEVDKVTGTK